MDKRKLNELLSQLGCIVLFRNKIYLQCSLNLDKIFFFLRAGSQNIPFLYEEDNIDFLEAFRTQQSSESFSKLLRPHVTPLVEEGPIRISCAPNKVAEWSIPSRKSVQVRVHNRGLAQKLLFKDIVCVAPDGASMFFRTYLAYHRMKAQIRLDFRDGNGKIISALVFESDETKTGGSREANYQLIEAQIPILDSDILISMSIDYLGYEDDGSDMDPFVFINQPDIWDTLRPAGCLEALMLRDSPVRADQQWYSASLDSCYNTAAEFSIVNNETELFEFQLPNTKIDIIEDYGHALVLQASSHVRAVVFLDGKPISAVDIGERTFYQFPPDVLDGSHHHLAIRDISGSQILAESIILLPKVITPVEILQQETVAPYPIAVFPQTAFRYESLKLHLSAPQDPAAMKQVSHALSVLESGPEKIALNPLRFPKVSKPKVSVIIPAHNQIRMTYLTLCSLLLAWNEASYEVILVDDGSSDQTQDIESFVSGIKVVRHDAPQRFVRACNAGAAVAEGEYIVLLNNDVEVTCRWLDRLLRAYDDFDNVGLVGAKLLYPNGRLQEAGGIVWKSGNPWNYGVNQNPWEPKYCYSRQTDYVSGAALMIKARLWKRVGGLSSYLEPMYFEDTDLAFKVRAAGFKTMLIPGAIVYHYEGTTSGKDVTSGFKAFQEVNRPKFKKRWGPVFAGFGREGDRPDVEKDRGIVGRVLFVDYAIPRPDHDAGSYAALQEMKLVQSLGYKVSFLPTNLAHFGSYTEALQAIGIEAIYAPFFRSVAEYLERHLTEFDAVYFTRYYVARDCIDLVKSLAPEIRILFNNADLHFLRELRTAKATRDPELLETARQTRDAELAIMEKVDVILSYNEVEHTVIEAYTDGRANVVKCPWVVRVPPRVPGIRARKGLSFLGSFRHHPNVEGIRWFTKEVMPQVAAVNPKLGLHLYGSGMSEEIRSLESDNVFAHGFVKDIADAFNGHRLFVAPLLSGAGIKGKIISAIAHGIPCVVSPAAAEGIGLRNGHDCFIAEKPTDWVEAIERLESDNDLWTEVSTNARTYAKKTYSFERGRELMRQAFEAVDMFQSLD